MSLAVEPAPPVLPLPPKPVSAPTPAWRRPAVQVQLVIGGLLGGLASMAVIGVMGRVSGLDALLMFAALFPSAWLHLLLHEAGHALMGWAGGQHVAAIGLGPWRFERGADGWRARKAGALQGVGGFALVLPTTEVVSRAARTAYLLGGPLANLVAAALGVAVVATFGLDGRLAALLHVFSVVGALIGLVNLVPFLSGGWSSDGRQLLALWRDWPEARAVEVMTRCAALAMLGRRPREWPAMPAVEGPLSQGLQDALHRARLLQAIDVGDAASPDAHVAARELADRFWSGPDGARQINALLLAGWLLKIDAPPEAIEPWVAESEGGLIDQAAQRAWVRAGMAALRGDRDATVSRIAEARAALPRVIDPASRLMLEEELDGLEARLTRTANEV